MTYSEKLKDPRWQKKRLKIFERDRFSCTECGSQDQTLHAHHKEYNGDPWDSPDEFICTLCERCHEFEEHLKKFKLMHQIALSTNKTCIWLWRTMSAIAFVKLKNMDDFNEIIRMLNSNCYDGSMGQKEFMKFLKDPNGQKIY